MERRVEYYEGMDRTSASRGNVITLRDSFTLSHVQFR